MPEWREEHSNHVAGVLKIVMCQESVLEGWKKKLQEPFESFACTTSLQSQEYGAQTTSPTIFYMHERDLQ